MNAENEMKELLFDRERSKNEFKELTGLTIDDGCLDYMKSKLPLFMNSILDHATAKEMMLVEYDNYMMSNKTKDKIEYEKHMEEMANKEYPDFPEDDNNYYCKYKGIYFEWNRLHMVEHEERHNVIGAVAKLIVDSTKSVKVDTRKNYGEVRYILECYNDNGKKIVVTCYRYDKTHIRIITAWEE